MSKYAKVTFLSKLDGSRNAGHDFIIPATIEKIDVHDVVLVKTAHGMTLAQVIELTDESDFNGTHKPILDVLSDASDHLKALVSDKRDADIHKEIYKLMAEVDERDKMEMYAAKDNRIKALLDRLG